MLVYGTALHQNSECLRRFLYEPNHANLSFIKGYNATPRSSQSSQRPLSAEITVIKFLISRNILRKLYYRILPAGQAAAVERTAPEVRQVAGARNKCSDSGLVAVSQGIALNQVRTNCRQRRQQTEWPHISSELVDGFARARGYFVISMLLFTSWDNARAWAMSCDRCAPRISGQLIETRPWPHLMQGILEDGQEQWDGK